LHVEIASHGSSHLQLSRSEPMEPPFDVQRIDHLVLRVRDLARSVRFYGEVLGCHVERRREHLGLVHLRAGASMIDLVDVAGKLGARGGAPAGVEGRNVDHLCLRIDPFDETALRAHLARFGIAPMGPAEINFGAEGDGLSLYFQDPDGNTIELKGPASRMAGVGRAGDRGG
jgi:catechol 2,3-dioxygenase-like lactoylglutathione lyase family enzyme